MAEAEPTQGFELVSKHGAASSGIVKQRVADEEGGGWGGRGRWIESDVGVPEGFGVPNEFSRR